MPETWSALDWVIYGGLLACLLMMVGGELRRRQLERRRRAELEAELLAAVAQDHVAIGDARRAQEAEQIERFIRDRRTISIRKLTPPPSDGLRRRH